MKNNMPNNKVDLLELMYKYKNKEYGSYILRKTYKFYMSLSLWIAVLAFVLGVSAPIIIAKLTPKEELKLNRKKVIQITELAEPPSIGEKKEIQNVEAPPPLKSTIKFLPPVVKPDAEVTEEYIPTVDELQKVDPGAKTQEGQEGGVDYSLIEVEETKEEKIVETVKEDAYTFVEEMPSFPSGNDELMRFIVSNIVYPEIAKRAGVAGKVLVQYVVEKTGDISDVTVLRGIGAGCDEEAVRVVKLMPGWKPGKQNGKPVRVRMVVPIVFKLQ